MKSHATGFLGALAVVVASAYLGIAAAAVLGLVATPVALRTAVVAGLVGLVAYIGPPEGPWRGGAVAGLALGLVAVIGLDLASGDFSLGVGQVGSLVGVVIAIPLLKGLWTGSGLPIARLLLAVIFLLVIVGLIRTVIEGGALGHDESAYAVKARAWLFGTPDTGWQLHRAPLISLLGLPVVYFTESEPMIRAVGVLTALAALGAVAVLAKRVGGWWTAVLASGTVAVSLSYLRRGSEYLTDIPAAGILAVITWVVIGAVRDPERKERTVLWLGPLVAAAFYMRYQSVLAIGGIAVGGAIAWPTAVRSLRRPLIKAAGVTVVALIPHLTWATVVTGRPWGIVLVTGDAAGRAFLGEGLVDYARMFPFDLAGPAGAVIMSIGGLWIAWAIIVGAKQRSSDFRLALFVLIAIIAAVVPLGLVAHGEPRFVFYPSWLLIILGSLSIVRALSAVPMRAAVATGTVAAILWVPAFSETLRAVDRNAEARGANLQVVVDASNAIEEMASGASCGVLTTYEPQVNWYSVCSTELFEPDMPELGLELLDEDSKFAVLFENGKRQPVGAVADNYLALGPNSVVEARVEGIGDATIVVVTDD